jgi:thioesterase domain-containing protein
VEAQLLAQPGVHEAVVVARDGAGGPRLVAYVSGPAVDAGTLRQQLGRVLPDYMVPTVIVPLAALPLNANGKVNRKALPEPEQAGGPAYEAPQGPAETALAALWAELLDVPRIGRNDNFFDLGGHSLLVLKLLERLRAPLAGPGPSLAQLFRNSRLADQAQALQQAGPEDVQALVLAEGGDGVPLYCFPGLAANTSEFGQVVAAVGCDRPVHGFVSHALAPERWQAQSIQQLAAGYAEHIRKTLPGRACALLGWSLGGDLAFETARQLEGDVAVVFLGLVDVSQRDLPAAGTLTDQEKAAAAARMDRWFAGSPMQAQWRQLVGRLGEPLRDAVAGEVLAGTEELPLDGPGYESKEYLQWASLEARRMLSDYEHGRVGAPVHVWAADPAHRQPGLPLRDWSRHGQVISVQAVPGTDHFTILQAPQLRAGVREQLREADRLWQEGDGAAVPPPSTRLPQDTTAG